MTSNPVDDYLDAFELRKKDRALSAEKLAKSMGGDKATAPILNSLDKIFDKNSLIHGVVTRTVVQEVLRRERREKNVGK